MSGNITRGWNNSRVSATHVCQTEVDVTSSTTLVNIPNLSHQLLGGATYVFEGFITGTSGSSGGGKVAIAGDGILTATAFNCTASNYNNSTCNAQTTTTTLGNAVGAATAVSNTYFINGTIVVNKPGRLSLQIAQNVSNGTATSAYVGSYLTVTPTT